MHEGVSLLDMSSKKVDSSFVEPESDDEMFMSEELFQKTRFSKKQKLLGLMCGIISLTILILVLFHQLEVVDVVDWLDWDDDSSESSLINPFGSFQRVEIGDDFICNDGTPAVYYIQKADPKVEHADRWLIQLVGGGSCGSASECATRWITRPDDMSTNWEEEMDFDEEGGMMNSDPTINPLYWDYNKVRFHYCTSDSWMGQSYNNSNNIGYNFVGAYNAFAGFNKLAEDPDFRKANIYLTVGISVGGTGILNLADGLDDFLVEINPTSERYFVSDCGWTLIEWMCYEDNCTDATTIGLYLNHNPYLNANCEAAGYGWECYYPEIMFHFIEASDRMMVAEQMYDSQMMPWAGFKPVTAWDENTIDWCYNRTEALIESYEEQGVHSVFTSNCRTHDFTEHQAVYQTLVYNVSFAEYIHNFINSQGRDTFWAVDPDHFPEANPTCQTDIYD